MSFYRASEPVARKSHRCEQCGQPIEIGTKHRSVALHHDGEFHAYREHFECSRAWACLNFRVRDLDPTEGAPFLRDDDEIESGDREWVRDKFPLVADRLGWCMEAPR